MTACLAFRKLDQNTSCPSRHFLADLRLERMDLEWDTSYPSRGTTLSGLGRGRGLRAATNAASVGALANQTAVMTLSNDDWDTGTSSQMNGSRGANFSRGDEPRGAGSRPMKCFKCQGEGHLSRECPNENGGNSYQGLRRNQDSNGGSGSRGCFKCGEEGHMSRECPNQGGDNRSRACFKCGEDGHMSRDCPSQGNGDNRSRACFKCGEDGHMSRDCPNQASGDSRPRGCFKCGEEGHMSRDCPNQASGDSRPRGCFKCGEEGHMSRDCPNQASGDSRPRGCFKCGEEGHMSRDCPNQGSSDNRSRACRKCGEEGHMARDCPQGGGGAGDNKGCFRCGAEGHMSRDCTEPATTADGKPREVNYVPPELDENEGAIFSSGLSAGINFDKYDSIPIKVTGEDATVAINSFEEARLRQVLMDNIRRAKYLKPTPVQKACIPAILARRDLMACAQTGSGKTAAFLIPILHILLTDGCAAKSFQEIQYPEVIVLAPTRELAIQIHREAVKFSYGSVIKCQLCYGGTSVGHQIQKLKQGVNILIATPGRMLDFMEKNVINLSNLKFLVLDEADRMLDMGFKPDIDKVFMNPYFPPKEQRNVVMFSATFPDAVQHMAMEYLNRYLYAVVGVVGSTNPDVSLQFFEVRQGEKRDKLIEILRDVKDQKVIVFVASKKLVDFLATHLCNAGFAATSMHGDRFQSQREEALRAFITGKHNILIATSVAARGLDVPDVAYVINYDLPNDPEEYVHKIGRTGRVGNTGYAISFYDPDKDSAIAGALVQKLKGSDQPVPEFLLAAIGGAGSGYGYGTGGGGRFANSDVRRHGGFQADAGRGNAPQPIESEENWD